MPLPLLGLLTPLVSGIMGIVSESVTDKDKKAELRAQLETMVQDYEATALKGQIDIVLAEAKGDSWLQRSWRPTLMMTIVAIIANNNLIAPWLNVLFQAGIPILPLDDQLYNLMTLGVGGYIAGRSGEKMITKWKGKD